MDSTVRKWSLGNPVGFIALEDRIAGSHFLLVTTLSRLWNRTGSLQGGFLGGGGSKGNASLARKDLIFDAMRKWEKSSVGVA